MFSLGLYRYLLDTYIEVIQILRSITLYKLITGFEKSRSVADPGEGGVGQNDRTPISLQQKNFTATVASGELGKMDA